MSALVLWPLRPFPLEQVLLFRSWRSKNLLGYFPLTEHQGVLGWMIIDAFAAFTVTFAGCFWTVAILFVVARRHVSPPNKFDFTIYLRLCTIQFCCVSFLQDLMQTAQHYLLVNSVQLQLFRPKAGRFRLDGCAAVRQSGADKQRFS